MRSNRLSTVMPALVAGIHVFLVALSLPSPACRGRVGRGQTWMAGTSPAMTPNEWLDGLLDRASLRD